MVYFLFGCKLSNTPFFCQFLLSMLYSCVGTVVISIFESLNSNKSGFIGLSGCLPFSTVNSSLNTEPILIGFKLIISNLSFLPISSAFNLYDCPLPTSNPSIYQLYLRNSLGFSIFSVLTVTVELYTISPTITGSPRNVKYLSSGYG